ncbi:MAG: site-specific integrase, partial [Hyphomicrobiales bacterium]|nr:site-specific integrase [Hyphomicrobiales bacterium]
HAPAISAAPVLGAVVPAIVPDTHARAGERFIEYFAATIRNPNTRAAYMNAVADFLRFEPMARLGSLAEVRSIHVSLYIESLGGRFAPQTVKQRLAALRGLFDWLARHGVLDNSSTSASLGREKRSVCCGVRSANDAAVGVRRKLRHAVHYNNRNVHAVAALATTATGMFNRDVLSPSSFGGRPVRT